jgi:hypothetical protein
MVSPTRFAASLRLLPTLLAASPRLSPTSFAASPRPFATARSVAISSVFQSIEIGVAERHKTMMLATTGVITVCNDVFMTASQISKRKLLPTRGVLTVQARHGDGDADKRLLP